MACNQGLGLLDQFTPLRWISQFSISSKRMLPVVYDVRIDMCRRSWAAVAPVTYERDSENSTSAKPKPNFAWRQNQATEL